jgi:hypothetical protein
MLQKLALPMERIELVVAQHRATSEAMRFIKSSAPGASLLLCVGEEDFASADNRFTGLQAAAAGCGVAARIQVLPMQSNNVHASQMRRQLAMAEAGLTDYVAGLPVELSLQDKVDLWTSCRDQLQGIDVVVRRKIGESFGGRYAIAKDELTLAGALSIDPEFILHDDEGDVLRVKYAGDTTSAGAFGDPLVQKPARRISVERRAVRYLSRYLSRSDFPTRVDFFDKEHRVLVLAGRGADATSVASEVATGFFSRQTARRCGELLANLHKCPTPRQGFWDDAESDRNHWKSVVSTLTAQARRAVKIQHKADLLPLLCLSARSFDAQPGFMHCRFTPENLWCRAGRVSFENLECAGNFGDPAYDIATFVAAYLLVGFASESLRDCLAATEEFELAYASASETTASSLTRRVTIFTACQLLAATLRSDRQEVINACLSCSVELIERFNRGDTVIGAAAVTAWIGEDRC